MIYNDGPEMDENLRITTCPRCGNHEFDPDAEYCQICGLPLFNECEGTSLYDSFGNYEGQTSLHRNMGNARFCKYCGAETAYKKLKILKEYTEAQDELFFPTEDDEIPW